VVKNWEYFQINQSVVTTASGAKCPQNLMLSDKYGVSKYQNFLVIKMGYAITVKLPLAKMK
jgi:hypothetical protein